MTTPKSYRSQLLLAELILGIVVMALVNSIQAIDQSHRYEIALLVVAIIILPLEIVRQFNLAPKFIDFLRRTATKPSFPSELVDELSRSLESLAALQNQLAFLRSTGPNAIRDISNQLRSASELVASYSKESQYLLRDNIEFVSKLNREIAQSLERFNSLFSESFFARVDENLRLSLALRSQLQALPPIRPQIELPLSFEKKEDLSVLLNISTAYTLSLMGRSRDADELFERSLERSQKSGNVLLSTVIYYYLGHSKLQRGEYEKAAQFFQLASRNLEKG
jgi:tetratricopeptide (TPR) repeat protein